MPKLKKKINYSILIEKLKKNKQKKLFSFKQKFYFLLIKMNFFYSNLFFFRTFNKQYPFSLYSRTLFLLTLHGWKVSLISKSLSLFTIAPWPKLTCLAFFSITCHHYHGSVGPSSRPLRRWCASGRDMKWWTVLDGLWGAGGDNLWGSQMRWGERSWHF